MFKRLSRWEELLLSVLAEAKTKNWDISALSWQKLSQIITRGLLVAGIGLFWCWNWKLLLATVVGIGLMLLVYLVQTHHFNKYWRIFQRLLTGYNRKFTLAVTSGGIGVFITYMVASIWADSENHWLATGSILQGLGTLATLLILGWHFWGNQNQKQETRFNELSQDLTASDPLKRLIAIRQLTLLVSSNQVSREYHVWLVEYYHLMLSQPQETLVKEALLDGLEYLDVSLTRESRKKLIQIPLETVFETHPLN
ncbi:MAG: ATP synthase subunit I [Xenococcaceae cyanobacterium MO_167.B27]|nr:ATP synthase subunit I [Xenococcaceae cyanobacterium MO_167.B27]